MAAYKRRAIAYPMDSRLGFNVCPENGSEHENCMCIRFEWTIAAGQQQRVWKLKNIAALWMANT